MNSSFVTCSLGPVPAGNLRRYPGVPLRGPIRAAAAPPATPAVRGLPRGAIRSRTGSRRSCLTPSPERRPEITDERPERRIGLPRAVEVECPNQFGREVRSVRSGMARPPDRGPEQVLAVAALALRFDDGWPSSHDVPERFEIRQVPAFDVRIGTRRDQPVAEPRCGGIPDPAPRLGVRRTVRVDGHDDQIRKAARRPGRIQSLIEPKFCECARMPSPRRADARPGLGARFFRQALDERPEEILVRPVLDEQVHEDPFIHRGDRAARGPRTPRLPPRPRAPREPGSRETAGPGNRMARSRFRSRRAAR